ncbi:hypothetical protein SPRG_08014 [Saprolegnia parasitica CBS 223.65]|uniref:PX domain-containing protein n=1 Tax=Saprolegnia parasitica (strain CBS 223.65) TaxID=695850 RepID=A0A067CBQ2_SAPPC|nr:hypothetical protein SPRG_08014 [Saprolegnia parasitica CBS 223.65]KDO26610.1 hypothetical protein SPRG_08014 [Saprolegnia parasitica CBS 223.65]|eukprot:XP_012202752.1 hypothetical protein SPRG_08014 [Saprolegnia parasitica CBS 223.65]
MEPATGTSSSSSSDGISTKSLAARLADAEAAAVEARKATEVAVVVNSRICAENALLRSKMAALLAERSENERVRENDRLKQHVLVLQSELARVTAISLLSAKVVESRVTVREGRQFVEYQLQIETDRRGTLYVWHRYSTFRSLSTTLHAKHPRVPDLPNTQLFGHSTAVAIQDRIALLNHFLGVACSVQDVPWAIRVDKDTVVYKHPKCPPMVEDELRTSSSRRQSVTSRLLRFSTATASKQSTIDE